MILIDLDTTRKESIYTTTNQVVKAVAREIDGKISKTYDASSNHPISKSTDYAAWEIVKDNKTLVVSSPVSIRELQKIYGVGRTIPLSFVITPLNKPMDASEDVPETKLAETIIAKLGSIKEESMKTKFKHVANLLESNLHVQQRLRDELQNNVVVDTKSYRVLDDGSIKIDNIETTGKKLYAYLEKKYPKAYRINKAAMEIEAILNDPIEYPLTSTPEVELNKLAADTLATIIKHIQSKGMKVSTYPTTIKVGSEIPYKANAIKIKNYVIAVPVDAKGVKTIKWRDKDYPLVVLTDTDGELKYTSPGGKHWSGYTIGHGLPVKQVKNILDSVLKSDIQSESFVPKISSYRDIDPRSFDRTDQWSEYDSRKITTRMWESSYARIRLAWKVKDRILTESARKELSVLSVDQATEGAQFNGSWFVESKKGTYLVVDLVTPYSARVEDNVKFRKALDGWVRNELPIHANLEESVLMMFVGE